MEETTETISYSRQHPSPRYHNLIDQYREMQADGRFTGIGCFRFRKQLRLLVRETGSRTLLDYGAGRGRHLTPTINPQALFAKLGIFAESWAEALGVERVTPYDPANPDYATLPLGTFDGVSLIDVAEHIDEDDLPWVLDEVFAYANKFVFLTVATIPAKKTLPNGENCHITLRSPDWWMKLIDGIAKHYPKVRYQVEFENGDDEISGKEPIAV